jgi:hypothetical protein
MDPTEGGIVLDRNVLIKGDAGGSDVWWNQTNVTDFNGTCDRTRITNLSGGEISLIRDLYDDFDDDSIDAAKWAEQCSPGFSVSENESRVWINGSAGSGCWTALGRLISQSTGFSDISADIALESGSGIYEAGIELYEDNDNYARLGLIYVLKFQMIWLHMEVISGGSGIIETKRFIGSGSHNMRMQYDRETCAVYLFYDQTYWRDYYCTAKNYSTGIYASAESINDSVSASFDNVYMGYCRGEYLSAPFDTGLTDPRIPCVRWLSPDADEQESWFYLRSSNDRDMASPTIWYPMNYSKDCEGLPIFRYIQYRVVLNITTAYAIPRVISTSIEIYRDIVKVEVSLDRVLWHLANGTTLWNIRLDIPDGERTVFCRATDAIGQIAESRITLIIDSTPPLGRLVIGNGAKYTRTHNITLSIQHNATFSITDMQISESSNLSDVPWESYRPAIDWNLSVGDGNKTVHARLRDEYGMVSEMFNSTIILDTIPPTGRISIEENLPITTGASVNISLEASDANGIAGVQISEDPGMGGQDWLPFASSMRWSLTPAPGLKTVYARFKDAAGHESRTVQDSILLVSNSGPGLKPTATMTVNDGSGFTRDRRVWLNSTISNGTAMWMALSNSVDLSDMTWQGFSESVEWTLEGGEGSKAVYGLFATADGQAFRGEARVILDTQPPSGTLIIAGGLPGNTGLTVTLRILANDANGAARMMISDGPDFVNAHWEPYADVKNISMETWHGTHYIYALIEDPAGWTSNPFFTGIEITDKRPVPTGRVIINDGNPYTNSSLVRLSLGLDFPSMAKRAHLLISNHPDFNGSAWENYTATRTWQLSGGDGNKTVHVLIEADGWISAPMSATICLDTVPPELPTFDSIPKPTASPTIRIEGCAEPGANLTIGGVVVRIGADGRFNLTLSLKSGKNRFPVAIIDLAGNTNNTSLELIREIRTNRSPIPIQFAVIPVVTGIIAVIVIFLKRYRPARIS